MAEYINVELYARCCASIKTGIMISIQKEFVNKDSFVTCTLENNVLEYCIVPKTHTVRLRINWVSRNNLSMLFYLAMRGFVPRLTLGGWFYFYIVHPKNVFSL